MKTASKVVLFIIVGIPIVLGIWWLMWSLWCWALPQFWPDGPAALIKPGYWLFVAGLTILSVIGRTLRGK